MKRFLLLLYIITSFKTLHAQSAQPNRGSSYQDSVRSQLYVKNEQRMIDGFAMNSVMDIVENITQSKTHTIFLSYLRSTSLIGTFKSRGPLTVFLPNDTAFLKKFSRAQLDTLANVRHKYELSNIITYHVLAGRFTSKDIMKQIKDGKGEASFLTLSGAKLTARIDNNRNIILFDENGGQSVVGQFDILQNNGIIHGITNVLIPKDKAL